MKLSRNIHGLPLQRKIKVKRMTLLTAASFTGLDSWFKQVSYVGAFGANDTWMNGWTNFDPENTTY
jgi:hypothetical protein